jgi:predicted lipoprotein with Yx(FWY)xxD motif
MKRGKLVAGVGAAVLVAGTITTYVVFSTGGNPVDNGVARLAVTDVPEVGGVLVDQAGRVLYFFEKDEKDVVSCTGGCASKWPPLTLAEGQPKPELGAGSVGQLVGEAEGENGARVVTYNGYPLYRYDSDTAGEATGQNKKQNGGRWFAVTASGERVK